MHGRQDKGLQRQYNQYENLFIPNVIKSTNDKQFSGKNDRQRNRRTDRKTEGLRNKWRTSYDLLRMVEQVRELTDRTDLTSFNTSIN